MKGGPKSSRSVYSGTLLDVVVEQWNGHDREIVVHPGSTAIVALDDERCVTLVRQLREPARRELLELPAGTIERGEANPAADEQFELVRWPIDEIEQHIGELEDAKTIAGLLLFLRTCP